MFFAFFSMIVHAYNRCWVEKITESEGITTIVARLHARCSLFVIECRPDCGLMCRHPNFPPATRLSRRKAKVRLVTPCDFLCYQAPFVAIGQVQVYIELKVGIRVELVKLRTD